MKKIGIIILVLGILCFVVGFFNSDFYWLLKIISFLLLGMGILILTISAVSKSEEKKKLTKEFQIPLDAADDDLDNYLWSWLDMGDNKVCPDCKRYADMEPASFTEWIQNRSEPSRGDTACGDKCRCALYPVDLIQVSTGDNKAMHDLSTKLNDLIVKYKTATNYAKLPKEYYAIDNFKGQIKFLTNFLELNK
ncbi:MAG: hypothetical protein KJ808_08895 [Acidobacteria bacterium]|nr:hypothetical protein [Acidobacteriota bacterium]MBU4306590.1 hypothetical protein [Acidobacteriota bacterium]MCG2811395.1 hypothetical protein [Candidatus Aminicenantes bacterium]